MGTCGGTVAALDCVLSVGATSGGLLVWFRMWSASNPEVVAYLEGRGGPLQLLRSASHCASGVWLAGVAVALLVALTPADPLGVLVRVVGGLVGGLLGAAATGLDIAIVAAVAAASRRLTRSARTSRAAARASSLGALSKLGGLVSSMSA